jgi:hypothetical protein
MRSLYSLVNRRRVCLSRPGSGITWLAGSSDTDFGISIDPVSMALKSMLSQAVSVWHQVDTQGPPYRIAA